MAIDRLFACVVISWVAATDAFASELPPAAETFWVLLHEPAVVDELKLSTEQQTSLRKFTDELDLRYLPLRNKARDEAVAGTVRIISDARVRLKEILKPSQQQRFTAILLWRAGTSAIFDEDVEPRMRLAESQRQQIQKVQLETMEAVSKIGKQADAGESTEQRFVALRTDEQKRILNLLSPEQRSTWKALHGKPFDLKSLGRAAYKVPQLIDTGEWINAVPLKPEDLKGKVVVVHFYAFGCINCIHNFPAYVDWQDRYKDADVVMVGIHTPETSAERNMESVRSEATKQHLRFPIVIDGKNENWNAWGNSMWPSIYLIDRRGYLRHFWAGELNWQGATGEASMRQWIDELLAERDE